MKKTVIVIALGLLTLGTFGVVMSDGDGWEHDGEARHEEAHERGKRGGWFGSREDVAPVRNPAYLDECGGCHFAYQPGLLPAAAWERVMDSLDGHYGDDATMDPALAARIRHYLAGNAADRSSLSRSRAFASLGDAGDPLPRITLAPYFQREHYEIPQRLVSGNKDVGGFGNCQACHRTAESGVYNEHQVLIPGVGRWDD